MTQVSVFIEMFNIECRKIKDYKLTVGESEFGKKESAKGCVNRKRRDGTGG